MLKKQYLKSKPVCKVTFTLPRAALSQAQEVRVLGDFNDWNWEQGAIMKTGQKEYKTTINLPVGQRYEFRYTAQDGTWENDWAADAYVPSPYSGVDNSVLQIAALFPPAESTDEAASSKAARAVPATQQPKSSKARKDDLKKIEGVGPKIEQLLQAAGIADFATLSQTSATRLKAVLEKAGNRYKVHDPSSWPAQASLAAKGDDEALKTLQQKLKKGKK
jgi:predicted flap endonuclease-1-like 5' DNA nuclease